MKLSKIIRCGALALSLFTANAYAGPYSSTIKCGPISGTLTIAFGIAVDVSQLSPIQCTPSLGFLYIGADPTSKFIFSAEFATDFSEITLLMNTGSTSGVGEDATWDFTPLPVGSLFESISKETRDDFADISPDGAVGSIDGTSARFTVDDDLKDDKIPYSGEYLAKYVLKTTGIVPGPDLPEPMSLALVGVALAALGVTRRKAARG